MKFEERVAGASALTGLTDILFGVFMHFTGWHEWYFNHFHVFGVFGFSMLAYSYWHYYLIRQERKKNE